MFRTQHQSSRIDGLFLFHLNSAGTSRLLDYVNITHAKLHTESELPSFIPYIVSSRLRNHCRMFTLQNVRVQLRWSIRILIPNTSTATLF